MYRVYNTLHYYKCCSIVAVATYFKSMLLLTFFVLARNRVIIISLGAGIYTTKHSSNVDLYSEILKKEEINENVFLNFFTAVGPHFGSLNRELLI